MRYIYVYANAFWVQKLACVDWVGRLQELASLSNAAGQEQLQKYACEIIKCRG